MIGGLCLSIRMQFNSVEYNECVGRRVSKMLSR